MATRTIVPAGPVKWTKTRQLMFLEHLAMSSNVAASERVALVPAGAAYTFRARSPAFRRAWEEALKQGYDRLELAMLERAINAVTIADETDAAPARRMVFSEAVAMTLLKAHRAQVAAITAAQHAADADADVPALIDGMARRVGHGD